ncbi:MAG: hypothetical protein HOP19_20810 [Acidobacteria bacterium]|nr:hypothetical protein [Acidobacteriota bacterium]
MKKQVKPKSKRTQVKDLPVEQQELTLEEVNKVKGGTLSVVQGSSLPIKTSTGVRPDGTTEHFFTIEIKEGR